MSKKKFKAGLESLFGEPAVAGMSPFLVEEKKAPAKEKVISKEKAEKRRPTVKRKKRSSSKNFTSDLESLFSDAIDKEYKEQSKPTNSTNSKRRIARKQADKPVIGLDALIRRTVAGKVNQDTEISTPLKRRLTITMERKKLDELKKVAKQKKAYLRDIIDTLVSDYLNNIDSNKTN